MTSKRCQSDCVRHTNGKNAMTQEQLGEAEAHINIAIRRLEMLQWFIKNGKKLSFENNAIPYFERVTNSIVKLQTLLFTDDQYTEFVARGLTRVNHKRAYDFEVQADKKGNKYYSINAILPLSRMKENVIFAQIGGGLD